MVERLNRDVVDTQPDSPVPVITDSVTAGGAFVVVPLAHVIPLARATQQAPTTKRLRPQPPAPLARHYSVIHTRTLTPGVEYVFSTRRDTT